MDSAVSGVFSFRDGWLRDMRNTLRGAGESFAELAKESIYNALGPDGAGILVQQNGIDSIAGLVEASGPNDVIFDFLDQNGDPMTGQGGYGAHALEFRIRLGSVLLDTGVDIDFNFDALEPALSFGVDGGFSFQVAWDLVIGFGFSLTEGFYISVDAGNELELRMEAGLTGQQDNFEVRAKGTSPTGYGIWDRENESWVLGPRKGDGSRDELAVVQVQSDGSLYPVFDLSLGNTGSLDECEENPLSGGPQVVLPDAY